MEEIRSAESLQFDFETIRVATENFSDANKLGQGGFGVVYKVGRHFFSRKIQSDIYLIQYVENLIYI